MHVCSKKSSTPNAFSVATCGSNNPLEYPFELLIRHDQFQFLQSIGLDELQQSFQVLSILLLQNQVFQIHRLLLH